MPRSSTPQAPFKLFDIFIGTGRTIRKPSGPPGLPLLQTHDFRSLAAPVSGPVSLRESNDPGSKPGSAKEASNANGASGSKPSSDKQDSKPSSDKENSKPDSKPSSAKAASNEKPSDSKEAGPSAPPNMNKAGADNGKKPTDDFTAEQDARLLLLKAEGNSWKQIARELGKPQGAIKKRFNDINPNAQKGGKQGMDNAGAKVTEQKEEEDKPKEPEQKAEERKSKTGKSEKRPEEKQGTPTTAGAANPKAQTNDEPRHHRHKSHKSHDREHKPRHHRSHRHHSTSIAPSTTTTARLTIKTMPSLREDDLFSFGELQALSELIDRDMENMWHRISAAFFGMTGRRIAPGDIKHKFAALGEE